MIERHENGALTWIDVLEPSHEEIRKIMEECNIPPELMNDLTAPVPRSEVIRSGNTVKITLDFPIVKRVDIEAPHEVKFLITKTHLITARYEDITAFHQFSKEFEVVSILKRAGKGAHGGHLFIALLSTLYDSLTQKLDYIDTRVSEVQKEVFNGREKEMVPEISFISRRLIMFRQALSIHERILDESTIHFEPLFTKAFSRHLSYINGHFHHLMRRIETEIETIEELRETNSALLSTKQNEIMKTLTIMAFITFPLSLFTSMFGMNTATLPIVGRPGDFWIILAIMGCVTIGFFIFFKYKRWM